MKKKVILLAVLILTLAMLCLTACDSCSQKPTEQHLKVEEEINLIVGESYNLTPTYDGVKVDGATFETSNTTVATVNEQGVVLAMSGGVAEVTTTYNGESVKTKVSVSLGDSVPTLAFNNVSGRNVTVATGDKLNLTAKIVFNGVEYDDFTISYNVNDSKFGAVENGIFTAKQIGNCEITVVADWRGVEIPLGEVFNVTIISNAEIMINDGLKNEYSIYFLDSVREETYDTQLELDCLVKINGEVKNNYTLQIVEGEDVVNLSGNVVTPKSSGRAVIRLSITDDNGVTHTKDVPVNCIKPLYGTTLNYSQDFSAYDGYLDTDEIFGYETKIVEAYENGQPLVVDGLGNVKGITVTARENNTNRTITVYDDKCGYTLNVNAYSKVFKKANDFDFFKATAEGINFHNNTTKYLDVYDGIYVLANDINASGYTTQKKQLTYVYGDSSNDRNGHANTGLMGIFDGRGHVIRNLTVDDGGIFGLVGTQGVIKNVGFEKSSIAISSWYGGGLLATAIEDGSTLENVYIEVTSVSSAQANQSIVAYGISPNANMNNVVVKMVGSAVDVNKPIFLRLGTYLDVEKGNVLTTKWNNVFVMSNQNLVKNDDGVTAVNEPVNATKRGLTGIYRYETEADLQNAYNQADSPIKTIIDGFNKNYWDVKDSKPFFKNLSEKIPTQMAYLLEQTTNKLSNDDLNSIFGTINPTILSASERYGNFNVEIGADNTILFKIDEETTLKADGTAYRIDFVTSTGTVTADILPVTKIFRQASDFDMFVATTDVIAHNGSVYYPTYDGYYVLGNDIPSITISAKQFTGLSGQETNAHSRSGLMGTFDGRGHTIGSVSMSVGGLFGNVGSTGVVKNVAFKNFSHSTTDWRGGGLFGYCVYAGATIENVYIETREYTSNGGNAGVIAYSLSEKANLNNFVIKSNITSVADKHNPFAFRSARLTGVEKNKLNDTNWNNFIILTVQNLGGSGGYVSAENETVEANKYGMKGLYKFADASALTTEYNKEGSAIKAKVDSFDTTYWTITNGVPTWKVVL